MQHYKDKTFKIKRYGQVFSGQLVGDLLVSLLPQDLNIKTMIDPMVGQGDLLKAAYEKYSQADVVLGIDIDIDVVERCKNTIPNAKIVIEDAFKSENIDIIGGWDLVITNPPYIRYQTLRNNPEIGLPSGKEIREGLINHIQHSRLLDDQDKCLFLKIARNYSGLSDMAVPSWVLCASIVKKGGYMAMVVPETWLSRNYALPVHYMLLRCFDIIAIANDVESSWFENAEIRTCLIICRRKENEAIKNSYSSTLLLELSSGIITKNSLVGRLGYDGSVGYKALEQIISERATCSSKGFSSKTVPELDLYPALIKGIKDQKWVYGEDKIKVENNCCLPKEIRAVTSKNPGIEYDSLEDLGWSVGQGLRTGANEFFYAELISDDTKSIVKTQSWYGREIMVSSENVRKAFKKRADIKGLVVNYKDLSRCIFYIQHQVRQSDHQKLSHKVMGNYSLMDPDLDTYITRGEAYISPSHKKPFKELSAVIPNEKKAGSRYERFWYMLPALKERHVPNLCISRVCGESPETIFVKQTAGNEIIVDANFITLWNSDHHTQVMTLALLNSTWAKIYLELIGTTMGGGALKIEADHVRKLMFPRLNREKKKELENIGKKLLRAKGISGKTQRQIDEIVLSPFGGENKVPVYDQLKGLLVKKIRERTGNKDDKQK